MVLRRLLRPAAAGLLLAGLAAFAPFQGGSTNLLALSQIERGQWQLREGDGPVERLCLNNPARLLQLRHGNAQCSQVIVENSRQVATIHYTCPGHGYGRTTVSVETSKLVRVETTGIVDGAPFSAELEGRRTGACN